MEYQEIQSTNTEVALDYLGYPHRGFMLTQGGANNIAHTPIYTMVPLRVGLRQVRGFSLVAVGPGCNWGV